MAVPRVLRARARVQEGSAGQVVSQRPDGAGQRAGARRALRALRRRGRVPPDGAVVLPDHRLRAGTAGRSRHGGLAGLDQGAPAELDRPLRGGGDPVPDRGARRGRGRVHHASGHVVRRHLLRARTGARAGPEDRVPGGGRVRAPSLGEEDRGAGHGHREDGSLHGAARGQPRERRAAAGVRRGVRADRLRDRRDHGRPRARPARPRIRSGVRPADSPRRAAGGRRRRRGHCVRRAHGG